MTTPELRAKAQSVIPDLERAREIAERAEKAGRAMTPGEKADYDTAMAKARPVLDQLKAARTDSPNWHNWASADNLRGLGGPTDAKNRRLSFKGMADAAAAKMMTGEPGRKSLAASGGLLVDQGFVPDPIALGRPATGLLDVLPVVSHATQEFAYLQQTGRTLAAAPVDEGDVKPTSTLGLTRVESSLQVIATLSEGLPRYTVMVDNDAVARFCEQELTFGLRQAVEAFAVAAIEGQSGIQVQPFSVSAVESIRKALTRLEQQGYTPGAVVLDPLAFESIELSLSTTTAVEYRGLPLDPVARRLYGVPIAVTTGATAGKALVLADGAVVIDTDTAGVQLSWSESSNGDDWSRNLTRLRVEGRYATSVACPLGVCLTDLVSAG